MTSKLNQLGELLDIRQYSKGENLALTAGGLTLSALILAAGVYTGQLQNTMNWPTAGEQAEDIVSTSMVIEANVAQNIEETRVSAEENITDIKHREAAENQKYEK